MKKTPVDNRMTPIIIDSDKPVTPLHLQPHESSISLKTQYTELAEKALELATRKKWDEELTLPNGRKMKVFNICRLLHLDPEGSEEDEEDDD